MAHQVTGDEDLVDEVNDPIHTHDVTRDHFGFLVESDAILRERGPAEACTATALPWECLWAQASHLPQPQCLQMTEKVTS